MRTQLKRKYRKLRTEFRRELIQEMDPTFALLILKSYTAYQHRMHIWKIWDFLGHKHRDVWQEYCDTFMGEHLTGSDDVYKVLTWVKPDLYKKYYRLLPGMLMTSEMICVCYEEIRKK